MCARPNTESGESTPGFEAAGWSFGGLSFSRVLGGSQNFVGVTWNPDVNSRSTLINEDFFYELIRNFFFEFVVHEYSRS
jgi:hypothetical protein